MKYSCGNKVQFLTKNLISCIFKYRTPHIVPVSRYEASYSVRFALCVYVKCLLPTTNESEEIFRGHYVDMMHKA